MKRQILILLLLALTAYGQQQKRIAIVNTEDDGEPPLKIQELFHLTDKLREIANKVLPSDKYAVMTQQSIQDNLGSLENMQKKCSEAQGCLAKLGREINADYIGQARIGRFGEELTIKVELYSSGNGTLINSFTGTAKNIYDLSKIIDQKAPDLFKKMPGVVGGTKASPFVAEGISGFEKTAADYEMDDEKRYVVNLSTEPTGAVLSFDGIPSASCAKTPCKAELREGKTRIIAALEQYETADTTVSIKQNNQNIAITLKPNFGILEIKPAYSDGIGSDKQWDLSVNGKPNSLGEIRLSPNKYAVKLNHECYEDINFNAGINKGKRELFDMAGKITLKKGGLSLSAERDGEPASEPVYVNGKQAGETPFSGSVPLCAKVEIGDGREAVDVKLKQNEKVKYTHSLAGKSRGGKPFADTRDGKKYKTVVIGKQTWMAENLNYNANGSKCYDNKPANCDKYGRLYDWNTAKTACPKGWHLPSDKDWNVLMEFVNPNCSDNSTCAGAGTKLKATSGWNSKDGKSGNGTDEFGFSALPGGNGDSDGDFYYVGYSGYWWSASKSNSYNAYYRYMNYYGESAYWSDNYKDYLFSVRCVQD